MATYLDRGSQEVDSKTTVPDQTTPKKALQDGELYASTLAILHMDMSKKYEQGITTQSSNPKQSASQTSNGPPPAASWFSLDIEEEQQKEIDKNKVKQKAAKDSTNKAENPDGKNAIFVSAKNITKVRKGAQQQQQSQEDQMKAMADSMLTRLNQEVIHLCKYLKVLRKYQKDPSYANFVDLVTKLRDMCPKGSSDYNKYESLLQKGAAEKCKDDHFWDGGPFSHWPWEHAHAFHDLIKNPAEMAIVMPTYIFSHGLFPDVGADAAALLNACGEAECKALIEALKDFIRDIQQLLGLMEAGKGKSDLVKVAGFMSAVQEAGTKLQKHKNKNQKDLTTALMQKQENNITKTEKKMKDAAAAKARAGIFSFIITFVSVIVMAVCACFGQFEVVAMMVLTMTLEKTGVMAKLTEAIAKGIGSDIGADVIVGVMELALTLGACGVGIARQAAEEAEEAAATVIAAEVAEAGVELAKEAIQTGAKTAMAAAAQAEAGEVGSTGLKTAMDFTSMLANNWAKSIGERVGESIEKLAMVAIKKLGTAAAKSTATEAAAAAGKAEASEGASAGAEFREKLLKAVIDIAEEQEKAGETIAAPAAKAAAKSTAKAAAKSAETGFANAIEEAIGNVNLISKVRIIEEIGKETTAGLKKLAEASFKYGEDKELTDAAKEALKATIKSCETEITSAVDKAMADLKNIVQKAVTAAGATAANVGGNAASQGTVSGASTGAETTAAGATKGIELQMIVKETNSVVDITNAATETAVKKGANEAAKNAVVTTEKFMAQGDKVAEAEAKQVAKAQVKKQIRRQLKSALYLGIGNGISSTNFAADVAKAADPNAPEWLKMLIEVAIEITTVILTLKGGLGSSTGTGEMANLTKSVKSGLKSMMDCSEETMAKMAMMGQYAQSGGIATESAMQVGSGISQIQIGMAQQAIAQLQADMINMNEVSKMLDTGTKEDMEHLKQMLKSQEADMSAAIENPGVIDEAIVQALNA